MVINVRPLDHPPEASPVANVEDAKQPAAEAAEDAEE